jgi:hypothetical protein
MSSVVGLLQGVDSRSNGENPLLPTPPDTRVLIWMCQLDELGCMSLGDWTFIPCLEGRVCLSNPRRGLWQRMLLAYTLFLLPFSHQKPTVGF